jgi:hypothetical protein
LGGVRDSEQAHIVSWLWPADLPAEGLDVLEGIQKRQLDDEAAAAAERASKSHRGHAPAQQGAGLGHMNQGFPNSGRLHLIDFNSCLRSVVLNIFFQI